MKPDLGKYTDTSRLAFSGKLAIGRHEILVDCTDVTLA